MQDIEPGDTVEVTNMTDSRYGQQGIVDRLGPRGLGWYVKFRDGKVDYVPYGLRWISNATKPADKGAEKP